VIFIITLALGAACSPRSACLVRIEEGDVFGDCLRDVVFIGAARCMAAPAAPKEETKVAAEA
jgi:hypothetical protein